MRTSNAKKAMSNATRNKNILKVLLNISFYIVLNVDSTKSDLFLEHNEPTVKSTKWDKYLKLVEEALKNYQECEVSNCSCYKR